MARKSKKATAPNVPVISTLDPSNPVHAILGMSTARVTTLIDNIAKFGKKYEEMVHTAACACIVRSIEDRNVDRATKLVNALPSLSRKNALIKWFDNHGPMKWTKVKTESGTVERFKVISDEAFAEMHATYMADKTAFADALYAVTFWTETKEESYFKGFTLYKEAEALLAKAEAYAKGETPKGEKLTPEQLAKVNVKGLASIRMAVARVHSDVAGGGGSGASAQPSVH